MKQPLISIIIPVYKVEKYIHECLDSVLEQSYKNLEIILIDDGSPDNCPKICEDYAKNDKRIIVIHQKNQGLSAARNTGIKNSKGEYLAFVDSDDIVNPNYISYLHEALNDNCSEISFCNSISFSETIPAKDIFANQFCLINLKSVFNIENSMCAWGKLFHKSLFQDAQYPVGKIHEDEFIIYKLLHKANSITYCKVPLYFYRKNENSIMHNKNEKFFLDFLDALVDNFNYFYCLHEFEICNIYLLRLSYLNTDYYNFCKTKKIKYNKKNNISKIIKHLPKKGLSTTIIIKVFIKRVFITFKSFFSFFPLI